MKGNTTTDMPNLTSQKWDIKWLYQPRIFHNNRQFWKIERRLNEMIIKTLKDAKQFIDDFKKYARIDPNDGKHKFRFNDLNIYVGGTTELILGQEKEFYTCSYGQNWTDKSESHIDDPIRYVWENRKSINAQLKRKD